jgi:hypothetical protein
MTDSPRGVTAGVRKAPRREIAGRDTDWAVPRAQLWGFSRWRVSRMQFSETVGLDSDHNFCRLVLKLPDGLDVVL